MGGSPPLLRRAAARALTGPAAFGAATAIDLITIFLLVARHRLRRRYHRRGDVA